MDSTLINLFSHFLIIHLVTPSYITAYLQAIPENNIVWGRGTLKCFYWYLQRVKTWHSTEKENSCLTWKKKIGLRLIIQKQNTLALYVLRTSYTG